MTDDEPLHDICRHNLDIQRKTYTTMYRWLAQIISSLTAHDISRRVCEMLTARGCPLPDWFLYYPRDELDELGLEGVAEGTSTSPMALARTFSPSFSSCLFLLSFLYDSET